MWLRGRRLQHLLIGMVIAAWAFAVFPRVIKADIYGGAETNSTFEDDFSGGVLASEWAHIQPTGDNTRDVAWPTGDGYRMQSATALFALAPHPSDVGDVSVRVDVTDSGNDLGGNANWGVACRVSPLTWNQYYFGIVRDGRPFIAKQLHDGATILKLGSSGDVSDGSKNRIRADCVGRTLTMYVNDREVLETEDGRLTSGGVGLRVESADVVFDNFQVTKPRR